MASDSFPVFTHEVDLCVVGGGMAGLCAALAAARHGATVALMHDRPVLGGNASSECRMHICGADRHGQIPNVRETGLLEELRLENLYRNPNRSYSIWDTILYEKLRYQPSVTLLLNCSCLEAEMEGDHIASVTGWQLTTETYHRVRARIFADCSGDGVLAPLTGAAFRMGREARHEFGESIAPEQADARTMGMTCLFAAKEYDSPQLFSPPEWASTFATDEDLPYGAHGHGWWEMGYWWIELGGEHDSIRDTESLRDELLRIVYGVWDHIKNRGDHGAENWALDWVQFLPAKRESRRYLGAHVLTQNDIASGGHFPDTVAYGGWTMDDHDPAGFRAAKQGRPATIFHPAPSPYGIPYGVLHARDLPNLMFAGRCASCTHAAMSSTRVMGTAAVMGQAVGTAAALAIARGLRPREVPVGELQQTLLQDDCHLPGVPLEMSELARQARLVASQGDPEPLRDGTNRPVGEDLHCWEAAPGDHVASLFAAPARVREVTLTLDSALDKIIAMSHHQRDAQLRAVPEVMPRAFRIEVLEHGSWQPLTEVADNHQRHVRLPIGRQIEGVRFTLLGTWGAARTRMYGFDTRPDSVHGESGHAPGDLGGSSSSV